MTLFSSQASRLAPGHTPSSSYLIRHHAQHGTISDQQFGVQDEGLSSMYGVAPYGSDDVVTGLQQV